MVGKKYMYNMILIIQTNTSKFPSCLPLGNDLLGNYFSVLFFVCFLKYSMLRIP